MLTKLKPSFCVVSVGLAFVLAGCHKQAAETASPPNPSPSNPVAVPPKLIPGRAVIYVVNPRATGSDDSLMPRTIALSQPDSPVRSAVMALLSDPNSPIPGGTSLRGITIDSGLATLDFSRSPVNETGGEGGQGDALTALGRTLGQFPSIEKFQINVKGQPVKSFGEFTTDGPIAVTRPETKS